MAFTTRRRADTEGTLDPDAQGNVGTTTHMVKFLLGVFTTIMRRVWVRESGLKGGRN
jgi:hypothetical protein